MGKRMIRVGSYWKRRQVGPDHEGAGTPWELHMKLSVGEYVEVLPSYGNIYWVTYCPVQRAALGDTIDEKVFRIYFEEVRDKAELGLIKLMEIE